jgi:Ca-activated chloride channel family protein
MEWAHPQAFWLLLLLPLAFWPLRTVRAGGTRLPGLRTRLARLGLGRWGPPILATLRAAGLALLILALARPQTTAADAKSYTEGIAIQLVLDTSLSMGYTDYTINGRRVSRLDAARHAIRLFVRGDADHNLPGRPQDLIGLVVFNRDPEVACPLTHAHDTLLASLDQVVLGPHTNIGDGLAWGLDRLHQSAPKQKVLILLSDGKHTVKEAIPPLEAAQLAADLGIRVYTIGAVGNRAANSPGLLRPNPLVRGGDDSIDEETLRRVAERTGGKYFRATDTDGLLAIYREIDQLEKTRITQTNSVRREEWFLYLLIPGLLLLCAEQGLAATRFLVVG